MWLWTGKAAGVDGGGCGVSRAEGREACLQVSRLCSSMVRFVDIQVVASGPGAEGLALCRSRWELAPYMPDVVQRSAEPEVSVIVGAVRPHCGGSSPVPRHSSAVLAGRMPAPS